MIWFTFSMIFHKVKTGSILLLFTQTSQIQSYYPFILPFLLSWQPREELSKTDQMTRDVAARNDDCHGENN